MAGVNDSTYSNISDAVCTTEEANDFTADLINRDAGTETNTVSAQPWDLGVSSYTDYSTMTTTYGYASGSTSPASTSVVATPQSEAVAQANQSSEPSALDKLIAYQKAKLTAVAIVVTTPLTMMGCATSSSGTDYGDCDDNSDDGVQAVTPLAMEGTDSDNGCYSISDAAHALSENGGGQVELPPGEYYENVDLRGVQNVSIVGTGEKPTDVSINPLDESSDVSTVTLGTDEKTGETSNKVTMSNLQVAGNGNGRYGIEITDGLSGVTDEDDDGSYSWNLTLNGVQLHDNGQGGLYAAVSRVRIEKPDPDSDASAVNYGLWANDQSTAGIYSTGSDLDMDSIAVTDSYQNSMAYAIHADGSGDFTATNVLMAGLSTSSVGDPNSSGSGAAMDMQADSFLIASVVTTSNELDGPAAYVRGGFGNYTNELASWLHVNNCDGDYSFDLGVTNGGGLDAHHIDAHKNVTCDTRNTSNVTPHAAVVNLDNGSNGENGTITLSHVSASVGLSGDTDFVASASGNPFGTEHLSYYYTNTYGYTQDTSAVSGDYHETPVWAAGDADGDTYIYRPGASDNDPYAYTPTGDSTITDIEAENYAPHRNEDGTISMGAYGGEYQTQMLGDAAGLTQAWIDEQQ